MAKTKKAKPNQFYLPVYIPDQSGEGTLEIGTATLRSGTLIIEFGETMAAAALQHGMERGEIIGVTFVIPGYEAPEETQEERDARDLKLLSEDVVTPDQITD